MPHLIDNYLKMTKLNAVRLLLVAFIFSVVHSAEGFYEVIDSEYHVIPTGNSSREYATIRFVAPNGLTYHMYFAYDVESEAYRPTIGKQILCFS